jgi:hypothetical protein
MAHTWSRFTISIVSGLVVPLLSMMAAPQEKREFHYWVGRKPLISITNHFGPITVNQSGHNEVIVTILAHSDAVSFVHRQHGNRIELRVDSKFSGNDLADYNVLVPADAFVLLRSLGGNLLVKGLRGDIVLEASSAISEVSDVADAHVHVKSHSGPVTLSDIHDSHLDIQSVTGNISIHRVTGSVVEVRSGSGRITYDGDPGVTGDYMFASHTGDLDISIPASAPVEVEAHSLKGELDGLPNAEGIQSTGQGNLLLKRGTASRSRFVLRSFTGKIRLKRP